MEIPKEFFSLATLATYGGLVAVVYVMVLFFKPWVKPFGDVWVRPFAAAVALIIQLFVLLATANVTATTVGLAIINSPLIALGAAGVHEYQRDPAAQTPQTIKPPNSQA